MGFTSVFDAFRHTRHSPPPQLSPPFSSIWVPDARTTKCSIHVDATNDRSFYDGVYLIVNYIIYYWSPETKRYHRRPAVSSASAPMDLLIGSCLDSKPACVTVNIYPLSA